MMRRTSGLQNGVARFALACVVAFGVSTALAQSNLVNVQISLTVDNFYALFAVNPNTNQLRLIGSETQDPPGDDAWKTVENYSFTAPFGSYIYVIGHDYGSPAMFVAKTVFNGSFTVLTGVTNSGSNWEVNETFYRRYNPDDPTDPGFDITDPNSVLSWEGNWQNPAVGRPVWGPGDFPHDPNASDPYYSVLAGAYHIWAQPGGGNYFPDSWNQWGFAGNTGEGTALFRLQVVPEPASLMALGAGLAGLLKLRRRKR